MCANGSKIVRIGCMTCQCWYFSVHFRHNLSSEVLLLLVLHLKVVVWTDFLHEPIISASEDDEDAYNFERFGTDPGRLGLGVFWVAGLPRVIHAGLGLLGSIGSLVFNAAVEFGHRQVLLLLLQVRMGGAGGVRGALKMRRDIRNQDGVFGVHTLRRRIQNLPSHSFGGRDDADGYVSQTGWVVPEVDAKRPIDVVYNFTGHQEAEFQCLHIEVEITPTQDFFGLWWGLCRRFGFGSSSILILFHGLGDILWPTIWTKWTISRSFMFGGDDLQIFRDVFNLQCSSHCSLSSSLILHPLLTVKVQGIGCFLNLWRTKHKLKYFGSVHWLWYWS